MDLKNKKITIEQSVDDPTSSVALTQDRHANQTAEQRQEERELETKKGTLFDLTYDKLIVTVGCYSQTFGTPGVKEHALVPLRHMGIFPQLALTTVQFFPEGCWRRTQNQEPVAGMF